MMYHSTQVISENTKHGKSMQTEAQETERVAVIGIIFEGWRLSGL